MARIRVDRARDLGEVIRAVREQRGLTQAQLAERIGAPRTYLSDLERGASTTALTRILKALDALDVDLELQWDKGSDGQP